MKDLFSFKDIIDRIYEATGSKTQTDIALAIGKKQSSISYIFKTRIIPRSWFAPLYDKHKLNPLWILTGQGEKTIDTYPSGDFYAFYKESYSFKIDPRTTKKGVFELLEDSIYNDDKKTKGKKDFKIHDNFLDNSGSNALSSSVSEIAFQFDGVPVYTFDSSNFNRPKIVNSVDLPTKTNKIILFEFNSSCMEPEIRSDSWLLVDTDGNHPPNINSDDIFLFCLPEHHLVPARTTFKGEDIILLFVNKEFSDYAIPFTKIRKYLIGKVVGTYKAFN